MARRVKVDTHVVLGLELGQDGTYGRCVLFGRVQVVHPDASWVVSRSRRLLRVVR